MSGAGVTRTWVFALPGAAGPLAFAAGRSRMEAVARAIESLHARAEQASGDHARQLLRLATTLAQASRGVGGVDSEWMGRTVARNSAGEPALLYYGAAPQFDQVPDTAFHAFGAQLGPATPALWRATPGGRLVPTYVDVRKPLKLRDCGQWTARQVAECLAAARIIDAGLLGRVAAWERADEPSVDFLATAGQWNAFDDMRRAIEEAGYDSIAFVDRGVAGSIKQTAELAATAGDDELRRLVPAAQLMLIPLRSSQLRPAYSVELDHAAMDRAIRRIYRTKAFWQVLHEGCSSGPFDGGCLVFAQAMVAACGRGELVRIASNLNEVEHYGARVDGLIYDAAGSVLTPQEWLDRFQVDEGWSMPERRWRYAEGFFRSEIVAEPYTSAAVARMIQAAYEQASAAQLMSPTPQEQLPGITIVLERAGVLPAAGGTGSGWAGVTAETAAVVRGIEADEVLARRLQAAGSDPVKARMVAGSAIQRFLRRELDPRLVDWSEVAHRCNWATEMDTVAGALDAMAGSAVRERA